MLSPQDESASTRLPDEFISLRSRYLVLLSILATVGCHLLKRGTIESYFERVTPAIGKPEAAAVEASGFHTVSADDLVLRYDDVVRALHDAAPIRRVNEDDLLRFKLAAGIAATLQVMNRETSEAQIAAHLASVLGNDAELFRFENVSDEKNLRLKIYMTSPIFPRSTFPFEITDAENLNAVVRTRLCSVQTGAESGIQSPVNTKRDC